MNPPSQRNVVRRFPRSLSFPLGRTLLLSQAPRLWTGMTSAPERYPVSLGMEGPDQSGEFLVLEQTGELRAHLSLDLNFVLGQQGMYTGDRTHENSESLVTPHFPACKSAWLRLLSGGKTSDCSQPPALPSSRHPVDRCGIYLDHSREWAKRQRTCHCPRLNFRRLFLPVRGFNTVSADGVLSAWGEGCWVC